MIAVPVPPSTRGTLIVIDVAPPAGLRDPPLHADDDGPRSSVYFEADADLLADPGWVCR